MTQAVIPLEPNRLLQPSGLGLMQLEALLAEAAIFVKSGLLPASVNTPEKAVLIMAAGHELGIPKTYALRNIHVIQGRPTCSAELMMALVQRDHGRDAVRVVETDEQHCTVEVRDGAHSCRFTWTIADAQRAKLAGKDTWQQYPRAMLRSRAVSEACRATFPGSVGGLYTAEEIGADVQVGADGAIDVVPTPLPAPEVRAPLRDAAGTQAVAARAAPSAPGGGATAPIKTASEFWAAAHGLFECPRGEVAGRVVGLLGQEAAAFKAAHPELTWSQMYDVLVGKYEDSQAGVIDTMATAWPEEEPDAEEESEAVRALRDDVPPTRAHG